MSTNEANEQGGSALSMLLSAACNKCESLDTEWHCAQHNNSGVVDGRLRINEVGTKFFLGCNHCSETIRIISGDDLARLMTEAANAEVSRANDQR